jgi:hypothetical protein
MYSSVHSLRQGDKALCLFRGDALNAVAKDNQVSVHQLETWTQVFFEHGTRGLPLLDEFPAHG